LGGKLGSTMAFRMQLRRWPNNPPQTFNDYLHWYKNSFERLPIMVTLVDKAAVKAHVDSLVGENWVVPTLYAGPGLPPLTERNWPRPYVLKPTHSSGEVLFVREGDVVDWPAVERKVRRWLAS